MNRRDPRIEKQRDWRHNDRPERPWRATSPATPVAGDPGQAQVGAS